MDTVAKRMDISNIVQRNEYVKLLSKATLLPYQLTLLSHFKEENDRKIKDAREISLLEAQKLLTSNLKEKKGDQYVQSID